MINSTPKWFVSLSGVALVLTALSAHGRIAHAEGEQPKFEQAKAEPLKLDCAKVNTAVNVSVSFTTQVQIATETKAKFESYRRVIDEIAKGAKLKKWVFQNSNYSLSSMSYGGPETAFSLSGNFSFDTDDADRALSIVDALSKKGMQPSVRVSETRDESGCVQTEGE